MEVRVDMVTSGRRTYGQPERKDRIRSITGVKPVTSMGTTGCVTGAGLKMLPRVKPSSRAGAGVGWEKNADENIVRCVCRAAGMPYFRV